MALLLRWWQSLLQALSLGGGNRDDGWVEPGNDITRAILSGTIGGLPTFLIDGAELPAAAVAEDPRPAESDESLVAERRDVPEEVPAPAEHQRGAPATRTRKRRGHRAA
ncbi:MAG: hypothetical protein ABI782_04570 [Anaerolineaceae bacterium]